MTFPLSYAPTSTTLQHPSTQSVKCTLNGVILPFGVNSLLTPTLSCELNPCGGPDEMVAATALWWG